MKALFTFTVQSGWRNTLLVEGAVRVWTLTSNAEVTIAIKTVFTATIIASQSVEAYGIGVTGVSSTLVNVAARVFLKADITLTTKASLTISTCRVLRADIRLVTLNYINTHITDLGKSVWARSILDKGLIQGYYITNLVGSN